MTDNNTLIEELIEIYKQPCIDDGDIDDGDIGDSVEPPIVNVFVHFCINNKILKTCESN